MWQDYQISPDDIEMFQELIPDYCRKQLAEGRLAGLVFINEDSDTRPVVGIVLYRVTKGYIEIEWVTPTDDYDLPDYGADMVMTVVNKARIQGGFRGVIGRFRKGDIMAEYFPEEEFSYVTEPAGVYRFKLSDVTEIRKYRKHNRRGNCVSLCKADTLLKNSVVARIAIDEEVIPLSLPVKWDVYEQDISAIYRGDSGADGVILIEEAPEELTISLLFSRNPMAAMTLLVHAFHDAIEKYGEDKEVACPILSELSEKIVEKTVQNPIRPELIRAEAVFPAGTGTMEDFLTYHPSVRHAADTQGT